ncbi:MAG: hypothetical protein N2201_07115 [candidate division WOR-3 bacterium]|nr:hypothetical protein [candidate division WOR-3 bacterium]
MHYETIAEPIAVECLFQDSHIKPKIFYWRNRVYPIVKVNGTWHRREGNFLIYSFAVTDENGNIYELEFNTAKMNWQLLKIGME